MTIKIHELKGDGGRTQNKRRIGRGEGSGWGRTSGKGNKGAQCRSGTTKGGAFEGGQTPLIRRVPKFGFSNYNYRIARTEVTLEKLNRFEDGDVIDTEKLHGAGLIAKAIKQVKIIAKGKLEKKLTLRLYGFSKGARAEIEKLGGQCEVTK